MLKMGVKLQYSKLRWLSLLFSHHSMCILVSLSQGDSPENKDGQARTATDFVTTWSTGWYINHLRLNGVELMPYAPACVRLLRRLELAAIQSLQSSEGNARKAMALTSLDGLVEVMENQARYFCGPVQKQLETVVRPRWIKSLALLRSQIVVDSHLPVN